MCQFAGSWDKVAGHQANLFSDQPGANSVDASVKLYTGQGVHPSKLVIGMPIYGRAFANTDGIGHPYQGQFDIPICAAAGGLLIPSRHRGGIMGGRNVGLQGFATTRVRRDKRPPSWSFILLR